MFLKLTKHELKESGRIMLPLSGLILVLALLAHLSIWYLTEAGESLFGNLTSALILFAAGLGCFAISVMVFVLMIERFRRTVLTDRGYLTNTLPVSVHGIIWSRLLSAFLYAVLVTVVVFAALTIICSGAFHGSGLLQQAYTAIREVIDEILHGSIPLGRFLLKAVLLVPLSFICTCLHFYAALVIGHSFANHKILLSVVFYYVISVVIRLLSNALLAATDFIGVMNAAASFLSLYYAADNYVLGTVIFEAVIDIGLYLLTWQMMKKRLNLA